jgi:hypothetical protein
MVANFLLYLRVSGQFHIIVGILHLFGFDLPKTHHLYYLSSSFTDFWRRINIYWKDFMQKVFFYPTYFWLRRWGATAALVLSTLLVFLITWILHAYQWFWLRGSFLLAWQDASFWAVLALFVVANSLYEAKHGRKRTLRNHSGGVRDIALHALGTVGTFTALCILWSLWTSDSLSEWFSLWAVAGVRWENLAMMIPILLAAAAVFGVILWVLKKGESAIATLTQQPTLFRSAVPTAALIIFLYLVGSAGASPQLGKAQEVIRSLCDPNLNALDAALLNKGYYEKLVSVNRLNTQLWQVYMKETFNMNDTGASRPTGDFRSVELVPSVKALVQGALFSTNRWGMRDQDYERSKPPHTYRIALLGSSHVMGLGVADNETFEALLEERLNRENKRKIVARYEILNFAAPGYCAIRELMLLENVAFAFHPNAVFYVAHAIEEDRVIDHLANKVPQGIDVPFDYLREIVHRTGIKGKATIEARNRLTPFKHDIVTWVYRRLVKHCQQRGIKPIWIYVPRVETRGIEPEAADLARHAEEAGFIVLDLSDAYQNQNTKSLFVSEWDAHPNTEGHQLIADRLYQALRKKKGTIPFSFSTQTGSASRDNRTRVAESH